TSSGGGASALTLKLGADFILQNGAYTGVQANSTVVNSSGVASNVVLDLNGHNFTDSTYTSTSGFTTGSAAYSISNSSGTAAKFIVPHWTPTGTVMVGNNVTLMIAGLLGVNTTESVQTTQFATGSTLQFASNNSNTVAVNGGTATNNIYNLTIGNTANNNFSDFRALNAGGAMRVNGDFLINQASNGNANHMDLGWSGGTAANTMYVAGNFTDMGGTGATSYNTNTNNFKTGLLIFNGGSTQRDVYINRDFQSALTSTGGNANIKIGESSTVTSNIRLTHNLTNTVGSITMLKESRLNVQNYTVTAGSLIFSDNSVSQHATFAYTFGTTNGLITTTGNLALNTFNLELTFDGTTWTNGNLLLFHYGTNTGGTPALGTITYNGPGTITSAGTLLNSGGNIYLQGLSVTPIPEPSTVFLLMASFGSLIVWKLRRRKA
ncbi:MAG: PEP-CTERM sorting domain-containing protein, partial [Chthoniobacterales bacterium]